MTAGTCYEIHAFAHSDVGRVRRSNEDAFFVADLTEEIGIEDSGTLRFFSGRQGSLFAVADGMGGAAAGEMASRLCLQALYGEVLAQVRRRRGIAPEALEQILADAVGVANRRIFEASRNNDQLAGMGTTLTSAIEAQGYLVIGQVGDSRAYLIRGDRIRQLTRDQSLVAQRVSAGELSEEEARHHPQRNILLQALGIHPSVELALRSTMVHPNDILLLCSDGLHALMSAEEILDTVLDARGPRDACLDLVDLANDRGGPDNITVVLIQFVSDDKGDF
jgi:serine/threonine protein phosphatase PrpC